MSETLTRGKFNVRIERVGRPEVKNMLLAPKQFDHVNHDLEIRDIYNMEDGFHLAEAYKGAYRARLNANLAILGRTRRQDGLGVSERHAPADRACARRLPRRRRDQPYAAKGSYLEIERAAMREAAAFDVWRPNVERRCDGYVLHVHHQRRERRTRTRRRRPVEQAVLARPSRTWPLRTRIRPSSRSTIRAELR